MKIQSLVRSICIAATLIVALFSIALADEYTIPITVDGQTYTMTLMIENGEPVTVTSAISDVVIGEIELANHLLDSKPEHIDPGSYILGMDIIAGSRWQTDRNTQTCGFAVLDESGTQIDFGMGGGSVVRLENEKAYELRLIGCGATQITENNTQDEEITENNTQDEETDTQTIQAQVDEKIKFEQICDGDGDMTSVQQSKFAKSFVGKRVFGWKGTVYDVYERSGIYMIEVNMRPDGLFNSRQIIIKGVDQEFAESIVYEQMVEFDATIQSVDIFWGTICNPINMSDPEIKVLN